MAIHVAIVPGLTPEEISVQATGHEDAPVSAEIMRDAFGIDDLAAVARDYAKAHGYDALTIGGVIWDASTLNSPAALNSQGGGEAAFDVNIDRCYLRLAPTGSKLVEIQQEVVLADHAIWDNRANDDEREFKAAMSVTSSTSVESSWEHSQTIGIAAEISTSIGPVEGKTSISYDDEWGESHGESHGQDVEFTNDIEGKLQPGELQVAALTQQRGFAKIRTDFAVSEPAYHYGDPATYGYLVGFEASGSVRATYQDHPMVGVSRVVVLLAELIAHAGKAEAAANSRIDTIGVFADADLASYPIDDTDPETIRKAVGAHPLITTYHADG